MKATGLLPAVATAAALVMFAACSSFTEAPATTTPDAASDGGADDASMVDANDDVSSDASEVEASPPADGCSDGTREGYLVAPLIAACDGYWSVAGITAATAPSCGLMSGNSGTNKSGAGCSASDLCAVGWHVCIDHIEVALSLQGGAAVGPCDAPTGPAGVLFYATAQASTGSATCTAATNGGDADDVFGCGDLESKPDSATCAPLNALFSNDQHPSGWSVDGPTVERTTVQHLGGPGGVLCCKE